MQGLTPFPQGAQVRRCATPCRHFLVAGTRPTRKPGECWGNYNRSRVRIPPALRGGSAAGRAIVSPSPRRRGPRRRGPDTRRMTRRMSAGQQARRRETGIGRGETAPFRRLAKITSCQNLVAGPDQISGRMSKGLQRHPAIRGGSEPLHAGPASGRIAQSLPPCRPDLEQPGECRAALQRFWKSRVRIPPSRPPKGNGL